MDTKKSVELQMRAMLSIFATFTFEEKVDLLQHAMKEAEIDSIFYTVAKEDDENFLRFRTWFLKSFFDRSHIKTKTLHICYKLYKIIYEKSVCYNTDDGEYIFVSSQNGVQHNYEFVVGNGVKDHYFNEKIYSCYTCEELFIEAYYMNQNIWWHMCFKDLCILVDSHPAYVDLVLAILGMYLHCNFLLTQLGYKKYDDLSQEVFDEFPQLKNRESALFTAIEDFDLKLRKPDTDALKFLSIIENAIPTLIMKTKAVWNVNINGHELNVPVAGWDANE